MAKVHIHFRSPQDHNWRHDILELERVPCIGEFVQVGQVEQNACKVMMVVHHSGFSDVWGEYIQEFEKLVDDLIPWQI